MGKFNDGWAIVPSFRLPMSVDSSQRVGKAIEIHELAETQLDTQIEPAIPKATPAIAAPKTPSPPDGEVENDTKVPYAGVGIGVLTPQRWNYNANTSKSPHLGAYFTGFVALTKVAIVKHECFQHFAKTVG